jgi:uncharacterized membrane protein
MPRAEETVTIAKPVGEVFGFIADGENNAKWRSGVVLVRQTTPGSVGRGTVFKQEHEGPLGRRIAADYEITDYEPGVRLAFRVVAGPARPEGRYTFDKVGGSTRVRFELSWQPRGWRVILSPMVGRQMAVEVGQLKRLKTVLEWAEGAG